MDSWKRYRKQKLTLDYMPDTSAAILMQRPVGGRILIYLCAATVVSFIFWAGFAQLDEIVRGNGKVVPSSRVQVIQNLEGGIISDVHVAEGDHVEAGDALMQLDNTRFQTLFRETEVEYHSLKTTADRLHSEINDLPLSFSEQSQKRPLDIARETAIYNNRRHALLTEQSISGERINQSRQELSELQSRRDHLSTSLNLARKELDMTKPLVAQGAVSEVELLRLKQRVNELAGDLDGAKLALPRLESALAANTQRQKELKISFLQKAMQEHKENGVRIKQLEEVLTGHQDRVNRTMVRSPVEGTVKKINFNTLGGVVQPGMELMEVVPLQDQLLVEAQIRPKDIAFLRSGLPAIVKITAYDFAIYGGLKATLEHISADTIQDESGQSFYIIRVRTEKNHLGSSEKPLPIIPGMQTSIDIVTGKKSVLDYLLKPINRARKSALRER
ncbi:hypothetical protein ACH42_15260 [Endozoicomonas sp. (ex Bugula neritina AB1)]|nr:hypothetical protein ACH42_15260 [Endozoicomonas sp. (ex Bugula neritina AB1)]